MSTNVIEMPRHRKLTGIAPWPIILLAGTEGVGKTWCAVEACMTTLVDGGYWFPLGEDDPDEYKNIPGFIDDRFDLVRNDGTYRDLLNSMLEELDAEKKQKRGPTMWVLDSGSMLWDLISGMAQHEMYARLSKKAAQRNAPAPDPEQKPAVDLWNVAADRWSHVIDALRRHNGPVIITARMEVKAVMNGNGEPTKDREERIITHKSLPFAVGAIVQLTSPGKAIVTKVKSVKLASLGERTPFNDFTVDKFLRSLGVDQGAGERTHSGIDPADKPGEAARSDLGALCDEKGWDRAVVAAEFAAANDGIEVKVASASLIRQFIASKKAEVAAA